MFRLICQVRHRQIGQICISIDMDSEEQNSNLEQDFISESIELFGALQKHRKLQKSKGITL